MRRFTLLPVAREFATKAHAGITRSYTDEPYINHCAEVAMFADRYGLPAELIAAAWLHDTVEDTAVTADDLRDAGFPPATVDAVAYMTDRWTHEEYPDLNRTTRKALETERLATGEPDQQTLKLCDLMSNTPSIVERDPKFARTYVPELRALLDALTDADAQAWSDAHRILRHAENDLEKADHP